MTIPLYQIRVIATYVKYFNSFRFGLIFTRRTYLHSYMPPMLAAQRRQPFPLQHDFPVRGRPRPLHLSELLLDQELPVPPPAGGQGFGCLEGRQLLATPGKIVGSNTHSIWAYPWSLWASHAFGILLGALSLTPSTVN